MPKQAQKKSLKELNTPKKRMPTPSEIKDMRAIVNARVEDAKTAAMYNALKKNCNEVDINLTKRFGALPIMTPVECPTKHGCRCDTCDYLVQYSLKNLKAYCLKVKEIEVKEKD